MEVLRGVRPPDRPGRMNGTARRTAAVLALALLAGCAGGLGHGAKTAPAPVARAWPLVTEEHVDLWLHGYAMLTRDAAQVPVFRRGYRDSVSAIRRRENVLTGLDANHQRLATLMAQNTEISNGQFLPLYFNSWDQMVQAIRAFLQAEGRARDAPPDLRVQVAIVASMFPTAQDREWLRLFTQSLGDESEHFFHRYWVAQQQERGPYVVAVDSLWQALRPRFQRFLTNTRQLDGELVLSIVLGGEGRTLNAGPQHDMMVVGLPDSRADLDMPIYGFAHEAVQTITNGAIADNTTPSEQRDGTAAAYGPAAAVRAGAMLMDRVAPEFEDGYMRFYLHQAGVDPPAGNLQGLFTSTFSIPTDIVASIARQLNTALGGT
jgi:hypothetical protein